MVNRVLLIINPGTPLAIKGGRPDGITQRGQIELVPRWRHNPDTPEAIEQRRLAEEEARRRAEEAARDLLSLSEGSG